MPQGRDEAGNIWEVDANGNPIRLVQAAQGQPQQPPRDPTFDYKGPQAGADLDKTRASTQATQAGVANDAARLDLQRQELEAKQRENGMMPDGRGGWAPIPGWKPQAPAGEENKQAQKNANLDALVNQINRVQNLYNKGFRDEPWGWLSSVGEMMPDRFSDKNTQFNAASSGLAEQGLAAFRVPGVGSQSDTELRQFVEANKPVSSDRDSGIEEKLLQLRQRVDATRSSLGLTPAEWTGLPNKQDDTKRSTTLPPIGGNTGNGGGGGGSRQATPWDQLYATQEPELAGGFGMDRKNVPFPSSAVNEYNTYVAKAISNGGMLDPKDFARFYVDLARRNAPEGVDAVTDPAPFEAFANSYNQQLTEARKKTGGVGGDIPSPGGYSVPMSMTEKVRHNTALAAAPVIGATNSLTFGGVEALAPEQMDALRNHDNPYVRYSEPVGEVAGAIYGTNRLAAAGRLAARAALPERLAARLLQGGGNLGKFARAVATDTTYGAGYGTVTEGDPIKGAAIAATASGAGQIASKGIGAAVRGATASAPAQTLRDLGVRLTPAQTLGGFLKSAEDKMTSVPIVGDLIRNRRIEGMRDFNRAAFGEAGSPINFTPTATGEAGLQQLDDALGRAYESATAGVTVPLDQQLIDELRTAIANGGSLAPDFAEKFQLALRNRVAPALDNGQLTGGDYQQAIRGLKSYRNEVGKEGFEGDYRNALGQVQDALTGAMRRQGGSEAVAGLDAANIGYGRYKTLKDAMNRGIGGTQSGEVELFTPSQLQRAGLSTEKKYGTRPFADLADAGQQVLPSRVPDSGTGGRIMQYAMPGLLGGAGAGYFSDNPAVDAGSDAAKGTLTVGALLAAMSTRRGQRAMDAILMRRPEAMQTLGDVIVNRSRIAGPVALPFMLENGN